MSRWRKRLEEMANDTNPGGYTYDEAAGILANLGFTLAAKKSGSHRMWKLKVGDKGIVIGLVDSGRGTMKAYLVRDMISQLRDNDLLPKPHAEKIDALDHRSEN